MRPRRVAFGRLDRQPRAVELRDATGQRYGGKGVLKAVRELLQVEGLCWRAPPPF